MTIPIIDNPITAQSIIIKGTARELNLPSHFNTLLYLCLQFSVSSFENRPLLQFSSILKNISPIHSSAIFPGRRLFFPWNCVVIKKIFTTKILANMHNPEIAFQPVRYRESENKGTRQQKSATIINVN